MNRFSMWFFCCAMTVALTAGGAPYFRITHSTTYIAGYVVMGNFALPVTGVATEGVEIGPVPYVPPQPVPLSSTEANERALGRFLGPPPRKARPAAQSPAPAAGTAAEKVSSSAVPREGLRTTTLCGTIEVGGNEKLILVVAVNGRETVYELDPEGDARNLLKEQGDAQARAVVIGKVDSADLVPRVRVEAVMPVK